MKHWFTAYALGFLSGIAGPVGGFVLPSAPISPQHIHANSNHHFQPTSSLQMVNSQFDVSKPVFDPLSLRAVRGDALVRYDALNQSEPLRITLYGVCGLFLLAAPSLTDAVGYDDMNLPTTIGSYLASAMSAALTVRECLRRSKQLTRMEKELNAESLPIRLPTNAVSDTPYTAVATLKELKGLSNPPRILAICGTKESLAKALEALQVLGRRLQQSSAYVVVVPTDGSTVSDWGIQDKSQNSNAYVPWLAHAYDVGVWREYFDALAEDSTDTLDSTSSFRWFGLNSSGRSFGSGKGEIPLWLQVLGQHLRPTDLLDEYDRESANNYKPQMGKELLDALNGFYKALTSGDEPGMEKIVSPDSSEAVSEVLNAGGRIDAWKACLEEGARPVGMKISGADSFVVSDTEAYTTAVEFPENAGIDSATLLAVQKWTRDCSKAGGWQLELHQTIPWSPDAKAQGTLLCDCRGCVALTRAQERRTFGGMIG